MPDGAEFDETSEFDEKTEFQITVHSSIEEIGRDDWDHCATSAHEEDNPFIYYDFLHALETTGCVSADKGWLPQHLKLIGPDDSCLAVAPVYLKNHSHGEYVFDWGWADAYERAGGRYYPKLVCAVPFTPVSGARFLVPQGPNRSRNLNALASGMIQLSQKYQASSIHVNFLPEDDVTPLADIGFLPRNDMQFHWQNQNYKDFDNFLDDMMSRKRRSIKKERKRLNDAGIIMKRVTGDEITAEDWDAFYHFYVDTYDRKWGSPYLNREFFDQIHDTMRDKILLVLAYSPDGEAIAGALNLIGSHRLYGRNWGCVERYKFLHFETCYYQAIEFAIERGLKYVEAGTQGQHKLQRGYMPVKTCSIHWINDQGFRKGVGNYLNHERQEIAHVINALSQQGPFKE